MKKFAAIFALVALAAAPALGADLSMKDGPAGVSVEAPTKHSWTQVFTGLSGACETGTTQTKVDGTETNEDTTTPFNLIDFQGIGSSGCSAAPFVGADWQIPGSRLVIGVEGEYRFSDEHCNLLFGEM